MCGGKQRKRALILSVLAAAVEKSIAALVIKGLLVVGTYHLHTKSTTGRLISLKFVALFHAKVNLLLQSVVSATTTRVQLFNFLYFFFRKNGLSDEIFCEEKRLAEAQACSLELISRLIS